MNACDLLLAEQLTCSFEDCNGAIARELPLNVNTTLDA